MFLQEILHLTRKDKKSFEDLVKIAEILRSPQGCPWDRKQKPSNYKTFLLEETYELLESIDKGKPQRIKEELGDLLLLVVMLAQIYKERGKFDIYEVINSISKKLILRHPHVFGNKKLRGAEEVLEF